MASDIEVESEAPPLPESEAPPLPDNPIFEEHSSVGMSSEDIARLRLEIKDPDPRVRNRALSAMSDFGEIAALCDAMRDEDPEVRQAAISAFELSGPEAPAQIVSTLQELLQTDKELNIRKSAAHKLDSIGEISLPGGRAGMAETLENGDLLSRLSVTKTIGRLGGKATLEDVALLKTALKDVKLDVRQYAAEALAEIGHVAWGSAYEFQSALTAEDVFMRRAAVAGLGSFFIGHQALSALNEAIEDQDAEVRLHVVKRFNSMGQWSKAAMTTLHDLMRFAEPDVRRTSIEFLSEVKESVGEKEIAILLVALQDAASEVSWAATTALIDLGLKAWPNGIDGVFHALTDTDLFVRRAASLVVSSMVGFQIDQDKKEIIFSALEDGDPYVRWMISQSLGIPAIDIWSNGVSSILDAYHKGDAFVRRAALASLQSVGASLETQHRRIIFDALEDNDFGLRYEALRALDSLGDSMGRRGRRALKKALDDEHLVVLELAVDMTQRLGSG